MVYGQRDGATSSAPPAPTARLRRYASGEPGTTWREWLIAPAYQQAEGETGLIQELQEVFSTLTPPVGQFRPILPAAAPGTV